MPVLRTGTAEVVNASALNSGTATLNIPADCDRVVIHWAFWKDTPFITMQSLDLAGSAFTLHQNDSGDSGLSGTGVASIVNAVTGSQTLTWTWSGGLAPTEGGGLYVTYTKGGDLTGTGIRDSGFNQQIGATNPSVTINSASTDLVLAHTQSYTPTNPVGSGTAYIDNNAVNNEISDVSEITAGATTTTATNTSSDYSSVVAIAIKEAGGAPDTTPDPFTFIDQTDVAKSTVITSAAITVTGINASTAISVTGGEYNINSGAFTSIAGNVVNGDTVQARHTSSASNSTAIDTIVDIGGVTDTFTSTTVAASSLVFDLSGATNVFKNNAGTALANRTNITADVYLSSTGDRVGPRKTGLSTDAGGNLTNISDASYTSAAHDLIVKFAEGEIALIRTRTPA